MITRLEYIVTYLIT